ncbi:hypothetical protein CRM22_000538 [Opisthorchis felineus]|uniref:Uncharacterized protein n=1 Tax=Opisthorchis felineus TaxID=147828 RepID=A0A4S2MEW7_OPIFE|nr:hypothetical protein CRM22_000538 [Opisthorchis felineus]
MFKLTAAIHLITQLLCTDGVIGNPTMSECSQKCADEGEKCMKDGLYNVIAIALCVAKTLECDSEFKFFSSLRQQL